MPCRDFTRAEALRASAARCAAGHGLPAVEPGMPLPAGTGLTRRAFLSRATGIALAVYGGAALAPQRLEEAITEAMAADPAPRVLVSVFLEGGLDALTALAPVGDSRYAALRPTLRLSADAGTPFAPDPRLRWHPAAAGLATLLAEGKALVAPAIGSSTTDLSHFTSRHFWETGAFDPAGRTGWLGRHLDRRGGDNPLQGLTLADALNPALATARAPVAAVSRPDAWPFNTLSVPSSMREAIFETFAGFAQGATTDAALATARRATGQMAALRRELLPLQGAATRARVTYPSSTWGRRLATLAEMIELGLPLRAVTVQGPGGYDTHHDQARTLPANLEATGAGLLAFQRDLEARGIADRVLTLLWSEFGRRAQENGSGTDHGAAGLAMVIGSRVRAGMLGEFPGLGTLDRHGNVRATADFRALYAALVAQWLGDDPEAVVPAASGLAVPSVVAG